FGEIFPDPRRVHDIGDLLLLQFGAGEANAPSHDRLGAPKVVLLGADSQQMHDQERALPLGAIYAIRVIPASVLGRLRIIALPIFPLYVFDLLVRQTGLLHASGSDPLLVGHPQGRGIVSASVGLASPGTIDGNAERVVREPLVFA